MVYKIYSNIICTNKSATENIGEGLHLLEIY